jgi:DNA (cytosine-5)-methyltransferase 1
MPNTNIRSFIHELGQDVTLELPNHRVQWGFKSHVHRETGQYFDATEDAVPVRLSRTASDGDPIRKFDEPFPAIDTATVWGWAQGNVVAKRMEKDRSNSKFVRSPQATAKLWRIEASRIRAFTAREYARIQTFPDDWVFQGRTKRELQLQIGNAVPVEFAKRIAIHVREALEVLDGKREQHVEVGLQTVLF